jgi:hypothetical protein
LDQQLGFHRRRIPDPSRNEVVQLIAFPSASRLAIG